MKIAIVGAAYTGLAAIQYLKANGHEAIEDALEEETKDAMGNIVKKKDIIPELEDMTRKQIKKHKKICKEKIKRNEELELHELVWCEVWGIETPDEM